MDATLNMDLDSNLEEVSEVVAKKVLPDRVWIALDENENIPPTGQYFGVNGVGYILRPGEPAYVPVGIVGILDDAVMATPIIDPVSRKTLGYRNKRRFSYQKYSSDPRVGVAA